MPKWVLVVWAAAIVFSSLLSVLRLSEGTYPHHWLVYDAINVLGVFLIAHLWREA